MSILSKVGLEVIDNHWRRPEDPTPAHITIQTHEEKCDPIHNGYTHEFAFTMRVGAQTTFYANQAQYEGRHKLAETELLHLIYGPVLARLHRMRARAHDRDYRAVLAEVDALEQELLK